MTAYAIALINVKDRDAYVETYAKHTPPTIGTYGGKAIVRSDNVQGLEGTDIPGRVVVLEFPDMDAARNWYNSEEYQALVPFRQAAAEGKLILVEGA